MLAGCSLHAGLGSWRRLKRQKQDTNLAWQMGSWADSPVHKGLTSSRFCHLLPHTLSPQHCPQLMVGRSLNILPQLMCPICPAPKASNGCGGLGGVGTGWIFIISKLTITGLAAPSEAQQVSQGLLCPPWDCQQLLSHQTETQPIEGWAAGKLYFLLGVPLHGVIILGLD